MTLHPRQPKDLMLAPVAAEVDANLQRIRDKSVHEVESGLELELNVVATRADRAERADFVLSQALRDVDLHGWTASITTDGTSVHLDGGSVSIDVGLGSGVTSYIQGGVTA